VGVQPTAMAWEEVLLIVLVPLRSNGKELLVKNRGGREEVVAKSLGSMDSYGGGNQKEADFLQALRGSRDRLVLTQALEVYKATGVYRSYREKESTSKDDRTSFLGQKGREG